MQTLHGYFQPPAPNAEARCMVGSEGSVGITLLPDIQPEDFQYYQVRLLRVFGLQQELILDHRHLVDCLFLEPGTKALRFLMHNRQFNLLPGTYVLDLLYQGQVTLSKSLVVPSQPWA